MPPGVPGVSENLTKLKTSLVIWNAKIQSKLNEIQKTFRKQGLIDIFFSILTVFHSWILALQLTRMDFSLVLQIFWHPCHPWGCVNSGLKQVLAI